MRFRALESALFEACARAYWADRRLTADELRPIARVFRVPHEDVCAGYGLLYSPYRGPGGATLYIDALTATHGSYLLPRTPAGYAAWSRLRAGWQRAGRTIGPVAKAH